MSRSAGWQSTFLQPATVALMASEQWRLSAARDNGAPDRDWAVSWGLGVQRFTDTSGPGRGDRLVEGGGFTGWGHLGDAYGTMAVFALDPAQLADTVAVLEKRFGRKLKAEVKVLRGGNGCAQRGDALRGVRAGHRVPVARF